MTTVAALEVVLSADSSSFNKGMDDASKKVKDFGDDGPKSLQKFGSGMTDLGSSLSMVSVPLLALGGFALSTASAFEDSLAEISARTGIVGDELQKVSDFALQMGADTAFSGQQALDAFLQLTTSGASTTEAFAMLPDILDAAAASGEDLGTTADVVTDILASFGLEAKDSKSVVDSLSRAAGASSADMSDLGQAFANVGGVAKSFGLSIDDTNAAFAIFAENGTKGAEAGTLLKSMLLNMSSDTDAVTEAWEALGTSLYDSEGNLRDFGTVLEEISAGLEGMSVEEQNRIMKDLAGSYGIVGLQALTGSVSIEEMKNKMADSADAATVAQARMNTFSGKTDSLMGSIQALNTEAITPLMEDGLTPLVEDITEVVNKINGWAKENPELTKQIMMIAAGVAILGPVLVVGGMAISTLGTAAAGAGKLIMALTSPLLVAGVAMAGFFLASGRLEGMLDFLSSGFTDVKEGLEKIDAGDKAEGMKQFGEGVKSFADGLLQIPAGIADTILKITEAATGWDLASPEEGINAFLSGVQNAGLLITLVFDEVERSIQRFVLNAQLEFLNFVAGFRDMILGVTNGTVDIAPDINLDTTAISAQLYNMDASELFTSALRADLEDGVINLSGTDYNVQDDGGLWTNVASVLSSDEAMASMAAGIGEKGKLAVQDALKAAISTGLTTGATDDMAQIDMLMPLALKLGIDPYAMMAEVQTQMATAAAESEVVPIIDIPVDPMVTVPLEPVQAQVTTQIGAGVYGASVRVDVTGMPGKIDMSAVVQAMSAQLGAVGGMGGGAAIPTFHSGGVFDSGQGEGFAWLKDGETVRTVAQERALQNSGGGSGNSVNLTVYGGNGYEVADMVERAVSDRGY